MDLDISNYNADELLIILEIPKKKSYSTDEIQDALFNKIENIKNSHEELPTTKENLITFFTKCFFKIVNEYKLYAEPSIAVKNKLMPELEPSHVFQQNNSMVAKHKNDASVPTWNTNYKAGVINPLQRKSIKKILNINTRFRLNYENTKSTDFIYELPYTVKKVVSMKLISTEFPKTVYTFSSNLGSTSFIVDSSFIDISSGSYSATDLTTHVNELLSTEGTDVSLNYNTNTGKMTFINNLGSNFTLNFNFDESKRCPVTSSDIDNIQLTLGWMLGFRGNSLVTKNTVKNTKTQCINMGYNIRNKTTCTYDYNVTDISNMYSGESSYTSEAVFDGHGTHYFLLSVNDYHNNHDATFISSFKNQSLADNNILAKISTDCCSDNCCGCNIERTYFGPIDLAKLQIRLYDEFGRIVDVNNSDYSFTIELELLYDL